VFRRWCRSEGLTLIEIAASLAVLAAGVAVLLAFRAECVEDCARSRAMDQATSLALERAALVRAGVLAPGSGLLEQPPGFAWAVAAEPLEVFEDAAIQACTVSVVPLDHPEQTAVLTVWLRPPPQRQPDENIR